MELLGKINSPKDLRKLRRESLGQVTQEVRQHILDVISQKGGHFASNLGTVELTVALHYVFETPGDKLVWDVGHQGYPHKILTGRRDTFHTIRQHKGVSGFLDRSESEYDHFGAGHASTSISAALGMAEGMRHSGLNHMAVAIIGDGSMTGGLAFEALNNAGHIPARNLVVVLNDNDMSIDPNVGALQKFINSRVTQPGYNRVRKELHGILQSLDNHGLPIGPIASKIRKSVKTFFTPGMLFESFGFRYFGPIDGHDIDELVDLLSFIKESGAEGGPYLVHAITKKGKGYKLAEELPGTYHGVSPFKIEDGLKASSGKKKANYQDVFADTLIQLAKEDPRIVAITAAMPSGTGLNKFQKEFPSRTYDVGIAEQHAVLFAAGLATEGFRPVAAIYSTFLQRAFDQIVHDVALQKLPVFFAMDRAGLVGADGATHQGQFDLSYLRSIPNMIIMAPKDENELAHMIKTGVAYQEGPIGVRYPRGSVVGVAMDTELKALPIGRGEVVNAESDHPDVCLIGVGYCVQTALEAQKILRAAGFTSTVVNARFIKPIDETLLSHWISHSRLTVTLEENTIIGGFGSAVLEMMNRKSLFRQVLTLGMPDRFVHHGTQEEQRTEIGLDADGVAGRILARLSAEAPETKIIPPKKAVPVYDKNIPIQ